MKYNISIEHTTQSKLSQLDFSSLKFGHAFTDHMFIADYLNGEWTNLTIQPFQSIPMHPAMSSIHYGQSVFEGIKAQLNADGEIFIFRPEMNVKRMNRSAVRMAMPQIPEDLFFEAMELLISIDKNWIPTGEGQSLYIRPFMFATNDFIGVQASDKYKFVIILSPVGKYYSKAVSVYADETYTRAFPGGTGFAKVAGNYAATLMPVKEIQKKGFDQILWLDGIEHKYLQEIGTMNFFVVIDGKVLTPSIEEDTILHGVTRDSVLKLCKHLNMPHESRKISIDELLDAYHNGTLQEAFGAGTAATISTIKAIGYRDKVMELDITKRPIADRLFEEIMGIKTGTKPDIFNWNYRVNIKENVVAS